MPQPFNIMIVGQAGRLQYEALVFVASLRAHAPGFAGRMIVAEPQPGPLWQDDPRMTPDITAALVEMGAEVIPSPRTISGKAIRMATRSKACRPCPRTKLSCFSTATR